MPFAEISLRDRPAAAFVTFSVLLASALPVASAARNGNVLWHVVHDLCVSDRRLTGHPAPCLKVDLERGYAVLTDLAKPTQLLFAPTVRLSGVEDPKLQGAKTPNYWSFAWEARSLLDERAGRPIPRDQIGLVVNSVYARTQNQLHIHLDCVRADVMSRLRERLGDIGPDWAPLDVDLVGHRYLARWIPDADLAREDPFKLIAKTRARGDMARQTLALVGARSAERGPGFVLLNDQADLARRDTGHGEDLLDHGCRSSEHPRERASRAACGDGQCLQSSSSPHLHRKGSSMSQQTATSSTDSPTTPAM